VSQLHGTHRGQRNSIIRSAVNGRPPVGALPERRSTARLRSARAQRLQHGHPRPVIEATMSTIIAGIIEAFAK
jgi:hypothetical protein